MATFSAFLDGFHQCFCYAIHPWSTAWSKIPLDLTLYALCRMPGVCAGLACWQLPLTLWLQTRAGCHNNWCRSSWELPHHLKEGISWVILADINMHCTRGETNKSQSIAFSVNSHLHLSLDGKWSEEITQSLEFPLAYDALVAVVLTNLWKIVPGNQEATSDISNSSSNT